nr:hypothetical protein [Acidobacteriota bacterium]
LIVVAVFLVGAAAFIRFRRGEEPVSRDTLLSRTFGHLLEGERESVLEDMRRLYQKTGHDVGIGMALGILLRHLGKNQVAIRTHRSLATRRELEPDFEAMIHTELAADYLAGGLLGRARDSVDKALALTPGNQQAVQLAERIYMNLGEWDAAFKIVQAYGKKQNRDVKDRLGLIRYRQGEVLLEEGRGEEANAAFKKAVAAHEFCLPAWLGQARYLRESGKPEKAVALLRKHADKFEGEEWSALEEIMIAARETADHTVFQRAAEQRLQEDHRDWRTRRLLAQFLADIGEFEQAGEHLLNCLEDRPQVLILHKNMWSLLLRMDNPHELMGRYQQRVKQDMVFGHTWECKACFYRDPELRRHCPNCHRNYSFAERKI